MLHNDERSARNARQLAFLTEARRLYAQPDRVAIDDNADVSIPVDPNRKGAWVAAWVWVPETKEQV